MFRRIVVAFALAVMLVTMFGGYGSAHAASNQLAKQDYKPGDLYASVIFSKSSDVASADGVDISYATLEKYPDSADKDQRYGMLSTPSPNSDPRGTTGAELSSYMKTLYENEWFVPSPKENDNKVFRMFQVIGDGVSNGVETSTTKSALSSAIFGANIFDAGAKLLQVFGDAVTHLNIPSMLGLVPGGADSHGDGVVSNVFRFFLGKLGVNPEAMDNLQYLFLIVIAFVCVMVTIVAISSDRRKSKSINNTKKWYSRLVVMMGTVTIGVLMTSAFNVGADDAKKSLNALPQDFNESYVVNTLDWAVYGNMDLAWVNPQGKLNTNGEASKDFEPSQENIERLHQHIKEERSKRGGGEKTLGENKSAATMLNNVASKKKSSINDYVAGVSGTKCNLGDASTGHWVRADESPEATWVCHRTGSNLSLQDFDAGFKNDFDFATEKATTPMFLAENDGKDDQDSKDSESGSDASSSDSKDEAEGTDGGSSAMIGGEKFEVPTDGDVKVRPMDLHDPSSYLYGAVPPGNLSASTKSFSNYIFNPKGKGFVENLNPETGEEVDTSSSDDVEKKKAKAINTNALSIGIFNRYAGLGDMRFSDQSTAFFLQTKPVGDDGISYKGMNTSANEAGQSKNTGLYGNNFTHYTMPSTNAADFYSKIGSMTAIWGVAGVMAIAVLLIMIRTPVFAAVFKSAKGFVVATFTGNAVELVRYVVYYLSTMFSFGFAVAALYLSVAFGKFFLADNAVISTLFGAESAAKGTVGGLTRWIPVIGDAADNANSLMYLIPMMLMSVLFCAAMCWPVLHVQSGGKYKKRSILAALITIPYSIAELLDEKMTKYAEHLYGTKGEGLGMVSLANRKNSAQAKRHNKQVDQQKKADKQDGRSTSSKVLRGGGKVALAAGITAATGGAGAGVGAGLIKSGLGAAGKSKMGAMAANGVANVLSGAGKRSMDRHEAGERTLGSGLSNMTAGAFNGAEKVLRKLPGGNNLLGGESLYMRAMNSLVGHDIRSGFGPGRNSDVDSAWGARGEGNPRVNTDGQTVGVDTDGARVQADRVDAEQAIASTTTGSAGGEQARDFTSDRGHLVGSDMTGINPQSVDTGLGAPPMDQQYPVPETKPDARWVNGQWQADSEGAIQHMSSDTPYVLNSDDMDIDGTTLTDVGDPVIADRGIDLEGLSHADVSGAGVTDMDLSDAGITGSMNLDGVSTTGSVDAGTIDADHGQAGSVSADRMTGAGVAEAAGTGAAVSEAGRLSQIIADRAGRDQTVHVESEPQKVQVEQPEPQTVHVESEPQRVQVDQPSRADESVQTPRTVEVSPDSRLSEMLGRDGAASGSAGDAPQRVEVTNPVQPQSTERVVPSPSGDAGRGQADELADRIGDRMDAGNDRLANRIAENSTDRMDDQARENVRIQRQYSSRDSNVFGQQDDGDNNGGAVNRLADIMKKRSEGDS